MASKKKTSISSVDIASINGDPNKYADTVSIKKLANTVNILNTWYFNTGNPLVDDDTYDILIDVLRSRDPENKILFKIGTDPSAKNAVQLPFSMPSLNKIKPGEKSLPSWFTKYKGPYIAADKLDGVSAQIYKNEVGSISLYTRGNSVAGRDVSHLLRYVVSEKSLSKIPNNTSIRGELLISKEEFKSIAHIYKNPRNTVAGIVNSENPDVRLVTKIQLVLYGIIYPEYKYSKQLRLLGSWDFKVVWNCTLSDTNEQDNDTRELQLINLLEKRKQESEFDVDGIVVTDDGKIYKHTDSNPLHSIAFKTNVAQNMKTANVAEVIWEPTMYGYLQPVIRIDPIDLLGTTITYVTGHNAKYIHDNKIGAGSKIKVVRSGDVIPYIVDVVQSNDVPDMPKLKYEWNENDVDIIVVNPSDEIKRVINIKRNVYFFRTIGAKFLNQGTMSKLYDGGYTNILDIIEATLNKDDIEIQGIGKILTEKIYGEIDKCIKNVKLPELMAGSLKFGRGLGVQKFRDIIKVYPNIIEFDDKDLKKIISTIKDIPNFSDVTARKFAEGLRKFKRFLKKIEETIGHKLDCNDSDDDNNSDNDNTKFADQVIVMTGFRDDKLTNYIEKHGGKVTTSVSKNTTLVICASRDDNSTKIQKAKELNITLMTKKEFTKK